MISSRIQLMGTIRSVASFRKLSGILLGFLDEEEIQVPFHEPPMLSNLDRGNLSILDQFIDRGNRDLQIGRNFFDV